MNAFGLNVSDLAVTRGNRRIISGVSFNLKPGTLAALVGPNGVGKSTLLSAIAGQIPSQGKVEFDGKPRERGSLSYMPQAQSVTAELSVIEVLLLGRRENLGWRVNEADLVAAEEMAGWFRLSDFCEKPMCDLSGGQQQLVLLAQRLMREPKLVILDEPTSALDLHYQLTVLEILRSYAATHSAVILAAVHDLSLASRHFDQVIMLSNGGVFRSGMPDFVLSSENISPVYHVELDTYHNMTGYSVHVAVAPAKEA